MNKINVVWLVNDYFINNFKTFYDEVQESEIFNLTVLAVPHIGYEESKTIESKDISNFLNEKGIKHIDSYDSKTKTYFDLRRLNPDYVFYLTPYNLYLPHEYYSSNVKKYAKVCHVSYGTALVELENIYEVMSENEFYYDAHKIFVENNEVFYEKFHNKYSVIGCLKLDEYIYYNKKQLRENTFTVIWKPRWTLSEYDSRLFEYIESYIKLIKKHRNISFKFYVHPLLEYKIEHYNLENKYYAYLEKMNSFDNFTLIKGSDFLDEILTSDVFVSDISSTMAEFLTTGNALIYTNSSAKLNKMGKKVMDLSYIVDSEMEFEKIIENLINNIDPLKEKRLSEMNKLYFKPPGNMSVTKYLMQKLQGDFIESSKREIDFLKMKNEEQLKYNSLLKQNIVYLKSHK